MDLQDPTPRILGEVFGERLQTNVPLARYTAARVGGPADFLLEARSADDLAEVVARLWALEVPFLLLGGGSNLLVSDAGVRGVVVLNRARQIRFDERSSTPSVWAESGANFGRVARQAAQRGLAGLEWAGGIPGTLGGAVFGNAGAHDGDMAGCLIVAEILQRTASEPRRGSWPVERLEYAYRSSLLKRAAAESETGSSSSRQPQAVVLAALLRLERSTPQAVQVKMDEFLAHRRRTQPPGASMGSMFKNPPGDYAGRLIEAAGLKGTRVGEAEISTLHANFFVNQGQASASDIYTLIQLAHRKVAEKYGVNLELEIELVGEWIP